MLRSVHRPSTATVIACLALFVALAERGIGAVEQLVPANSVGTPQLRNSAVTTPKVRNNAITTGKVLNGSLRAVDFAAGQLPGIRGYEVVSGTSIDDARSPQLAVPPVPRGEESPRRRRCDRRRDHPRRRSVHHEQHALGATARVG